MGLVPDNRPGRAPPPSKNRIVLCRAEDGTPVLVKIAQTSGPSGITREGQVLRALAPLTASRGCPLGLPIVHGFDPERGILALRWLEGAETLHSYRQRTGRLGVGAGRQIGRAIGWLHMASRGLRGLEGDPARVPQDSDFAELFTYLRPEVYARLSRAGIELIGAVQRHKEAVRALVEIARQSREPGDWRLLHGDCKPANILRPPDRPDSLVFVDWERAVFGDPARDLGALLAEYVLVWLAPEPGVRALRPETLRSFASALLQGYRAQRNPTDPVDAGFESGVIRWAGLSVLVHVYGITHYEGEFDARAQHLAAYAADLLGRPALWVPEILGSETAT